MNDTVPFAIFAYNQFNIKRMNEDFDYSDSPQTHLIFLVY